MEFTKTQTSIIVLEIVFIFSGIVAIFRAIKPKIVTDFSSPALISTATVLTVYVPHSKANISKSVTVELITTKKKFGNIVNLYDEKPAGEKIKKPKKESEVITIDLGEEEKKNGGNEK